MCVCIYIYIYISTYDCYQFVVFVFFLSGGGWNSMAFGAWTAPKIIRTQECPRLYPTSPLRVNPSSQLVRGSKQHMPFVYIHWLIIEATPT